MGILLGLAPFILFAIVEHFAGATAGLAAGAVVSAALLIRGWATSGQTPKILDIGATVLFCGSALYAAFGGPTWSLGGVGLCVNLGLLVIVLFSIAVRRPFTLQYAREQVPREFWNDPRFLRTNTIITAAWALAFLVMVIASLVMLYVPGAPSSTGIIATVVALIAAGRFTGWYAERARGRGRAAG